VPRDSPRARARAIRHGAEKLINRISRPTNVSRAKREARSAKRIIRERLVRAIAGKVKPKLAGHFRPTFSSFDTLLLINRAWID